MKKIIFIFISLLSIFNIDASAYVKYVTANLNLRYGPGTSYSVLAVIPKGTPVTIDEDCDCKWVPVEYNGRIGYISTKYLSNSPVVKSRKSSSTRYRNVYANRTGKVRYYTNLRGHRVQSPTRYSSRPAGATALCRDGTYSFSQSRRGTCSHHGGVAVWY